MAQQAHQRIPRGFTLLELLLVLAVLVAAAAIAIPLVVGPLEGQRVRKAADQVRAAFNRAKVEAMRTGRIQLFRFQSGTNLYIIEPLNSGEDYLEASPEVLAAMDRAMVGGNGPGSIGGIQPEEIAENTMFVRVANLVDMRSARVLQQMQASGATGQLSEPIMFYPDGTSSTTRLVLANQQEQFVVIQLRGLTGMAQVSPLLTPEEVPQ